MKERLSLPSPPSKQSLFSKLTAELILKWLVDSRSLNQVPNDVAREGREDPKSGKRHSPTGLFGSDGRTISSSVSSASSSTSSASSSSIVIFHTLLCPLVLGTVAAEGCGAMMTSSMSPAERRTVPWMAPLGVAEAAAGANSEVGLLKREYGGKRSRLHDVHRRNSGN